MNISEKYPEIKESLDLLDPSNYTKEELDEYYRQVESDRLYKLKIESIVEEGRIKGREEGKNLVLSIIEAMSNGKTNAEIAADFKLDIQFVENLLAEIR
jgi:predicted transposase YdaD